jgi:hypothetical protein
VESYRVAREGGSGLLTTNYVITELVALLVSPLRAPRAKIIAFIDSLKGMDRIEIFQGESQTGKMGFSTSAPPGWSALLAASLKGE